MVALEDVPSEEPPFMIITLIILLLGAGVIYTFGYLRAVLQRARGDLKGARGAIPGLRKTVWSTLWKAVKVGTLLAVGLLIMVAWVVRDAKETIENRPKPASVSPAPSRR